MGWREVRQKYDGGRRLAPESDESLVARRILKGLGLRSQDIWDAELAEFGDTFSDRTMFDRAKRLVFARASASFPVSDIAVVPWLKTRTAMLDSVRERVEQMEPGLAAAIAVRPDGEKRAVAWVPLPRHYQIGHLPKGAAVEFDTDDFVVVRAAVEDLVEIWTNI